MFNIVNFFLKMMQICGKSIYKPLSFIVKQYRNDGLFQSYWRKEKQTISREISFSIICLICDKIFKRLLFQDISVFQDIFFFFFRFLFLPKTNLSQQINLVKINRLTSVTFEICKSSDDVYGVTRAFTLSKICRNTGFLSPVFSRQYLLWYIESFWQGLVRKTVLAISRQFLAIFSKFCQTFY